MDVVNEAIELTTQLATLPLNDALLQIGKILKKLFNTALNNVNNGSRK